MVPAYQDISHFRAPYKNSWLSGYGEDAPPTPTAPPAGVSPDLAQVMFDQKDGANYFKPIIKAQILSELARMKYVFVGGPTEYVRIEPYSPEELLAAQTPAYKDIYENTNAGKWVSDKVKEGKVVLAPAWVLAPVVDRFLLGIPARNVSAIKQAANTPYMGILDGSTGLLASLGTTGKIVVGVAAALGVAAVVVYAKKRRRGGSLGAAFK